VVTGIIVGVVAVGICFAVIFATPIGPLVIGALAVSPGAGLAPIIIGVACGGIGASFGFLGVFVAHRCTSRSQPQQRSELAVDDADDLTDDPTNGGGSSGDLGPGSPSAGGSSVGDVPPPPPPLFPSGTEDTEDPGQFLKQITDPNVIKSLTQHAGSPAEILVNSNGYVVIKDGERYFSVFGRDGAQVHRSAFVNGRINGSELFSTVAVCISSDLLADTNNIPVYGLSPAPLPSGIPPPPSGNGPHPLATDKPKAGKLVPLGDIDAEKSKLYPNGLAVTKKGQLVDGRNHVDTEDTGGIIIMGGINPHLNGINANICIRDSEGKYRIPLYALQNAHKTGEHALPEEWIDTDAVAPDKPASAPKAAQPKVELPDLSVAHVEELHDGLGVAAGKDGVVEYLVDMRDGANRWVLNKDSQPIPWGFLENGKIPSWFTAGVNGIPDTWVVLKKRDIPDGYSLRAGNVRFRGVDIRNMEILAGNGITCTQRNGNLSVPQGRTTLPLKTKTGMLLNIRHLVDGKIPASMLDDGSKAWLRDFLKDKTLTELWNDVATAESRVRTASAELDEFEIAAKTLPNLLESFPTTLKDAMQAAGIETDIPDGNDYYAQRQKVLNVKNAVWEYLLASSTDVSRRRTNLKKIMFDLSDKDCMKALDKDREEKFTKFIGSFAELRDALQAARLAGIQTLESVGVAVEKEIEKLKAAQSAERAKLDAVKAELELIKNGITKYKRVVADG
jgi:hypothetical protein